MHMHIAMWAPSGWELLVVLIIALLLFGKRLPDVARSLGKGIVEFKKGVKGIEDDVERDHPEPPRGQLHSTSAPSGSQEPRSPSSSDPS